MDSSRRGILEPRLHTVLRCQVAALPAGAWALAAAVGGLAAEAGGSAEAGSSRHLCAGEACTSPESRVHTAEQ